LSWIHRLGVVLLLTPVVTLAQAPQGTPTFRAETRRIEVDVFVTDKDGNAVRSLSQDDFELFEDGKPQRISNFSLVDLPIDSRDARKSAVKMVESDITSNAHEGRLYVMLFGGSGERARLIARQFIEEAVQPNDLMAVVHPLGLERDAQGFTSNRGLLLAAIDRMAISHVRDDFSVRFGYEVVEQISERLASITGRRKVLLWFFPELMDFDATDSTAFMHRDAVRAATRNNVAIYPVGGGLGTGMGIGALKRVAMLRLLAEETGGDAIAGTNNFSDGFQRFARDVSTYYLLGYEPAVEHRDGKFHKLAVRVKKRPGLTVRARPAYYATDEESEARAAAKRGSRACLRKPQRRCACPPQSRASASTCLPRRSRVRASTARWCWGRTCTAPTWRSAPISGSSSRSRR
jgi:VWFA-related protein